MDINKRGTNAGSQLIGPEQVLPVALHKHKVRPQLSYSKLARYSTLLETLLY